MKLFFKVFEQCGALRMLKNWKISGTIIMSQVRKFGNRIVGLRTFQKVQLLLEFLPKLLKGEKNEDIAC